MEKNQIIITKGSGSDNTYYVGLEGCDSSKESLGWTRVLGPAEGHYAICLEKNYTEGAVTGRGIHLLGVAHSKEELSDRVYQLVRDYATNYAENMQRYGSDTEVVDKTKGTCSMIRLAGPCGDLASKL
ncbi:MAG: hypothetical protein Q7S55_04840 [Nanoarchaeota archaeon]|nr:hypothetical protein [Nanoarchaeota archaeon]